MPDEAGVFGAIHHTVLVVRDIEASLRFYRDGLGLAVLRDFQVYGDWPDLFGAPSRILRAIFLGDAQAPDDHAGVLELNAFHADAPEAGCTPGAPSRFMMSFIADVEKTLGRLDDLGMGGPPRRVVQPTVTGEVTLAAVLDPDGVYVLLISGSITQGT